MKKEITAQEGYKLGRKKGWCVCANCGIGLSFSDKKFIKEHVSGEGCKEFRDLFGLPKNYKFEREE